MRECDKERERERERERECERERERERARESVRERETERPSSALNCASYVALSVGPVAQWIRHRPTEPGIAGSSPPGSQLKLAKGLLTQLSRLHVALPSIPPSFSHVIKRKRQLWREIERVKDIKRMLRETWR